MLFRWVNNLFLWNEMWCLDLWHPLHPSPPWSYYAFNVILVFWNHFNTEMWWVPSSPSRWACLHLLRRGEGGMWFDWCNTTNSRTLVWNNFLRKMLWMQKQKKCCWKATWMMRMMKKKEHGDVDEWSSLFRTLSQEDVVHAQNVLYKNGLSANGWSNIGCLICDRIVQSIWWATDILCWRAWEIYSCCNVNKTYLLKSTISRFCVNLCDAYRLMLHGNNQYSVYSYNIKVQYCYR